MSKSKKKHTSKPSKALKTKTIKGPKPSEKAAMTTLLNEGRLMELEAMFKTWIVRFPEYVLGWQALGALLKQLGRDAEAVLPIQQKIVELLPEDALAHLNLGNTLRELGQLDDAVVSYRQALTIKSDLAETLCSLGITLRDLGKLAEAEIFCKRAIEIKPDYAEAHSNLGITLLDLGRQEEAETACRRALDIKPDLAEAHCNLGIILRDMGRLEEAISCCQRALEIKPDFVQAYSNLSVTYNDLGQLNMAEASCRKAIEIKPDFAEAHCNLGLILSNLGRLYDAENSFRQALKFKPDFAMAHSAIIFTLDLMIEKDITSLQNERKQWDVAHAAHLLQQPTHTNTPDPNRRLRIGYVSADLKNHSAITVFGSMLTLYDRAHFDVYAYSNFKGPGDEHTELFRQNVTAWRNIADLSDDAVAMLIKEDRIDILVDLSGHSAGNRLLVFARKPAPIQITAWGYATGTGMRAMDVFFADPVLVPPEDKHFFAEQINYLPCAIGAFFTESFPDVNEIPAFSNGNITFGSFNRMVKVSDETYRIWAEVLIANPGSRLILKTGDLNDPVTQKRVVGNFISAGVAADRIIMQGRTSKYQHMEAYHQIDIILDTIPHGGGVTTLESLMMGVPVITLRWPTMAGRVSASIMSAIELHDWIAETKEQYVAIATQKASDLQSLSLLRRKLRKLFTSSVIGDQAAYTKTVEKEYKLLWQEWCSSTENLNFQTSLDTIDSKPIPKDAEEYFQLGNTQLDLGELDIAVDYYHRALELNPNYAEVYCNLGNTFSKLGQLNDAMMSYRRALEIKPNYAVTHYNLGIVLKEMGLLNEAETLYRQALQIKPDFVEAHSNLAYTLKEMGRLVEAEAAYRRALKLKPDYAEAYYNLGIILYAQGRLNEAEASYQRALQIKPDYVEALNNLGSVLQDMEQIDSAQKSYRLALAIKPDFTEAHSNLIFSLDLTDTTTLPELYNERIKWAEAHAKPLWQNHIHTNIRSPLRRLRIGYVSADFRNHSAPKVFGGLLTRYDRTHFDVYAYSNYKGQDDKLTELFRQNVTAWRSIAGLSDDAVAMMIQEDQIDILIDLSGHSAGNRLLVFARKPAPIQITAWGYATGTGMRAMDVFFADPVLVPPEDIQYFAEAVRYLPCAVGAFFTDSFPDVNELPVFSDEFITFGSFNRLVKVSEKTYNAWAKVLLAIPNSRFILKSSDLDDPITRSRVVGHFTKAGVDANRIIIQGKTSWHEHMQTYHQVDISLDTFPHGGGVTTMESLMMGVPVITLRWPTMAGRVSASIITTLGLIDWIAETQEQYLEIAIQKAKDLSTLTALRKQLRPLFMSSIIGDTHAYIKIVEQEYRQLWQEWCESAANSQAQTINPQESLPFTNDSACHNTVNTQKSLPAKSPSPVKMNRLINLCTNGSYIEAEKQARKLTIHFPKHEFGWKVLGLVLKLMGKSKESLASMQKAVEVSPHDVEAHYNLGLILLESGRLKEAETSYRHALQIDTNYAIAHSELGRTLIEQGRVNEAEESLRIAVKIKPDFSKAHSGLLFALDLMMNKDTIALQEERRIWDATHAAHLLQQLQHTNIPDPNRRIRIGYVSADFRDHSAAIAFGCMLTRYDRSQFDVFAYSNHKEENDKFANLFKQNVTTWRNILGLMDDTVAKIIIEDQIDILVDLSGHSAGNRLLVFARKPAPIQITAWGYASSTGMRSMDVFFTDKVTVPTEEQCYFTEQVRYLPCTMSALFIEQFPDVNKLPALSDGNITFGSFNRLAKLSENTYQTWAELLLAVPGSRLMLKTPELSDPATREQITDRFTKAGVAADRITLQGKTSWYEHMQAYQDIDIALDPFPHGGGVTALEGLMMGIPVITLCWPTIAGRLSASIVTTLGLPDWIAETQQQYIEIAINKVKDLPRLATLRQQLRPLFRSSMLGDVDAYTRIVEHEYRQLWQEWCSSAASPSPEEIQQLITLLSTGNYAEAEKLATTMTELFPLHIFGWKTLGVALQKMDRFTDAVACMQKAAALSPDDVEAHYNLAVILHNLLRDEEAFTCFQRVLQFEHDQPYIHNKMGDFLRIHGQLDEAEQRFRRALQVKPDFASAHSNLIFTQDLMNGIDAASMLQERIQWNTAHAAHLYQQRIHSNNSDSERRIRIGYVSADFSSSSAPSIFAPMLFDFNRSHFDVIAYSNDANNSEVTLRIQQNVTCWRYIVGISDDDAADLIRQDKIDILVDLSGHSRDNRLLVFARKPAPIQITAWGYSTGTGMKTMDVLFSDPVMIPPCEKQFYVEQVRYLPSYLPYTPPSPPPAINPLPALTSKIITFGCFSRGERISDDTLHLWIELLKSIPKSRLLLKPGYASYVGMKERITTHLNRAGVELDRATVLDSSTWEVHMSAHNLVDIALDPFPQCGGVTTLECLIMGVPVITLLGTTFIGRTGPSFLTTLNLSDWIAETPEQYFEIAKRKAQDISALAVLRQQLRTRLTSSIIGDSNSYAKIVEQEYRQLWRDWCNKKQDED